MARKPTDDPAKLLTVLRVAETLDCSTKSVRRLIDAGDLPVIRLGRLLPVHPDDLERLIRSRREG